MCVPIVSSGAGGNMLMEMFDVEKQEIWGVMGIEGLILSKASLTWSDSGTFCSVMEG